MSAAGFSCRWYGAYPWAAFFLVIAALNLAGASWFRTILRSRPDPAGLTAKIQDQDLPHPEPTELTPAWSRPAPAATAAGAGRRYVQDADSQRSIRPSSSSVSTGLVM